MNFYGPPGIAIAYLEPGRLPSTVDPDTVQPPVLRPISSQPYPHDADYLSGSGVSGSSPVSNRGLGKAGASRSSPSKSSYPPSQASKEDSISMLSSPQHSNLATSTMMQQQWSSNRDHFNPMYEQEREVNNVYPTHVAMRNNSLAMAEGRRSSVFWDQEAGRFVASSRRQISGTELLYTGRSMFYGSPVVNEQPTRGTRNST